MVRVRHTGASRELYSASTRGMCAARATVANTNRAESWENILSAGIKWKVGVVGMRDARGK